MNQFKQKRAVAECKAIRAARTCPHECRHWNLRNGKGEPFCKDAYSAERRGK
jgi:hypothetical protein